MDNVGAKEQGFRRERSQVFSESEVPPPGFSCKGVEVIEKETDNKIYAPKSATISKQTG